MTKKIIFNIEIKELIELSAHINQKGIYDFTFINSEYHIVHMKKYSEIDAIEGEIAASLMTLSSKKFGKAVAKFESDSLFFNYYDGAGNLLYIDCIIIVNGSCREIEYKKNNIILTSILDSSNHEMQVIKIRYNLDNSVNHDMEELAVISTDTEASEKIINL